MNILISGIHGFVGSNLVVALKSQHSIYGLDIVFPQKEGVVKTFAWNELETIPKVDVIIHLAGKAHDTRNQTNAQVYFDINTGLTEKIYDWFLSSGAKKFIFFSSVKAAADRVEGEILTEDVVPSPKGPYGESKIKAENYILSRQSVAGSKESVVGSNNQLGVGSRKTEVESNQSVVGSQESVVNSNNQSGDNSLESRENSQLSTNESLLPTTHYLLPTTTYPLTMEPATSRSNGTTNSLLKTTYILRPCMIHGPGNKGNLNLLYQAVKRGIPYPLGAFENRRSFTSIDNLSFVIEQLIEKDIPTGIYNMGDDETLSTNELITLMAATMGKPNRIWNWNKAVIQFFARIGTVLHLPLNTERLQKLTENYVVSNAKLKQALGIDKMPVKAEEGFRKTVKSL